MTAYANLEMGLHRWDADSYAVELRFSQPESDAEVRLVQEGPSLVQFDLVRLRSLETEHEAYGQRLAESLFDGPAVQTAFAQARSTAQSLEVPLRMRLFIGPSAPELHSLRWERLRDPQDGTSLLTSEHILFSRYLSSLDWQPVRLRPQADLRALVVIANPDLTDWPDLAPVDVTGELERARSSLGDNITVTTALASEGSATLDNLTTHLRDGYDILYLVCHGALIESKPMLWLEKEAGDADVVNGEEVVTRLKELRERPRLVVLVSCQSAGSGDDARTGDEGALAALGPRLAEAGIPAVLAMQGNVTMKTVAQFMPVFFKELQRDGQIDRAMAVARGTVRERPDWWMPVLFMRLKSGRLWYTPGFAEDQQGPGAEKWPALIGSILDEECTPILGPGLTESLFGSRHEIAQRLAEEHHFPMAPHDREDLPQVAQYLAVNQSPKFPPRRVVQQLYQEIQHRYDGELPDELRDVAFKKISMKELIASLNKLTGLVWKQRQEHNPAEPHWVLARLPFKIYITTDPSNLLVEALRAADKKPRVELCPWNDYVEQLPSIYEDDPDYEPSIDKPLVYHLFGHIQERDSLVLTEDDYFDYLIGVTSNRELIPLDVRGALTDTALLFLGFQMDDWNFRVLFRSIMGQQGQGRLDEYAHIAAQITPEEGRIMEPERARRYLEDYFQKSADISIYWGSAKDFIAELYQRWDWEE